MGLEELFGEVNKYRGDTLEDTAANLQRAISVHPSPELKLGLAMILGQIDGGEEESRKLYKQVLDSQPNNPIALTNFGATFIRENPVLAGRMFAKVILEQSTNGVEKEVLSLVYTNMGVLHENASYFEIAYREYRQALRADPSNQLAMKYAEGLKSKAEQDMIGFEITEEGVKVPVCWTGYFIEKVDKEFEG